MGQPQDPPYDSGSDSDVNDDVPSRQPETCGSNSDSDSDAPEMVTQQMSKQISFLQRNSETQSHRYLKEQRKKRLRMLAEQHQRSSIEKLNAAKSQKLPDDVLDCINQVDTPDESDGVEEDEGVHYIMPQRPQKISKDGFQLQSLASLRQSSRCHEAALKIYEQDTTRHQRSITYRNARPAYQFISGRLHK